MPFATIQMLKGSFPDMANALKEIREIINSGQVKDKNIYAKPLSQYSAPYYQLLLDVDLRISAMLAELNRAKQHQMYFLTAPQKRKIDGARDDIIRRVNAFCRAQVLTDKYKEYLEALPITLIEFALSNGDWLAAWNLTKESKSRRLEV